MLDSSFFPANAAFCSLRTVANPEPDELNLDNYRSLHPLEQAIVRHSVPRRKAEFGDARWCAHQALKELGQTEYQPILRGPRGMPLWPAGFTGSMTHTEGFRAAVVCPTTSVASIGLDAEPNEPLPVELVDSIARPGEKAQLERMCQEGIPYPERLLFCAKEATYKAWFPLTQTWLGFEDAEIDLRCDGTLISYILARPTPVPFISGNWAIRDGYIIATTTVEKVLSPSYLPL
ncbi:4'-phosphopantetheinyl transferase family protein [Corynebacterium caspium]|uniref:4'-phosphopantetheinyl transferase family protein n=1 Tax=Corynebacterium caspium TaxID=234828 RepID=UPI0003AADE12|nr:4'-phosphopantetheinyl transferase superfamily protein [Corynebacterium caspium]WKD59094.1 4'-phosphopantetheinyl transferase Npt [Corynebacterium caspium DSM 44850]